MFEESLLVFSKEKQTRQLYMRGLWFVRFVYFCLFYLRNVKNLHLKLRQNTVQPHYSRHLHFLEKVSALIFLLYSISTLQRVLTVVLIQIDKSENVFNQRMNKHKSLCNLRKHNREKNARKTLNSLCSQKLISTEDCS